MIDKKNDVEASSYGLDMILNEELKTFDKQEFQLFIEYIKDLKSSKSRHNEMYKEFQRNTLSNSAIFDPNHCQLFRKGGFLQNNNQNFSVTLPKAYGILGFVKFLKGYYLIMITQRKKVAKIGFHSIYQIKDIKMIPCFKWTTKHN